AERETDLGGAAVVPGFNDAHNHLVTFGRTLSELSLRAPAVRTLDELYAAVAARAKEQPTGSWIVGSGYDQNKLGGHPARDALDRVAAGHLVWLKHTSGHMCAVNSAVLERMGAADGDARAPEGGAFGSDEIGRLTGLVQETAQLLVRDLVYPYPIDELVATIAAAAGQLVREGVTSATEAGIGAGWIGSSPVEAAAYAEARTRGVLPVRMTLMTSIDAMHDLPAATDDPARFGIDLGLRSGFGDEWLRLGPVKLFADGSLIGRTAAMTEPYAGEPDNRGFLQMPAEELTARILAVRRAGWQVATHAIGDAALDVVLDAYAQPVGGAERPHPRHRVEHCATTRPDQLSRLVELGAIPVPQGRFANEIGDGMLDALGPDRAPYCYRQRSFLDAGLVLPGSSDRPVVNGAPLLGIADLVNQRTSSGRDFNPGEALTVEQALHAWTVGSAYAVFDEGRKGTLTPGRLADFVVLSDDLAAVPPAGLADVSVLATVIGGGPVYDAAGLL
ncbi:MAG: amidohydrolase, partial [Actinomycetota bacterium]|nr:amidohydrolase [Actinomycetota bacterium]